MNSNTRCPIWGTPATEIPDDGDGQILDSPRAGGKYFISGTAVTTLASCNYPVRVRLTTWLVEQRRLGDSLPIITTKTISAAEQWTDTDVSDRADGALKYLARKTNILGTHVSYRISRDLQQSTQFDDRDKTYCELLSHSGCVGHEDFVFLIDYLRRRGLVEEPNGRHAATQACTVTVEGYSRLAELEKAYPVSRRAFVAMWFDDSMNEAWEHGFEPAVRYTGYEPVRIDRHEHVNKIDDKIIAELRRARFVIADFTHGDKGARGGVYYEAGFAHGLAIPVIFTCRKDSFDTIHFDTRQYNHIVWTEPEELRVNLASRISAVIGDGPNKTPD